MTPRALFGWQDWGGSVEDGGEAFGVALDKEPRDLRTGASSEDVPQLKQSHTHDFRAPGMRVAFLLQQIDETIDPFSFGPIEADGQSSVPSVSVARVWRCHPVGPW